MQTFSLIYFLLQNSSEKEKRSKKGRGRPKILTLTDFALREQTIYSDFIFSGCFAERERCVLVGRTELLRTELETFPKMFDIRNNVSE